MRKKISISDVFTPTRFPTYSYVARRADYESVIDICISSGFIAFIHGPTKSGKTVLAEKVARDIGFLSHKISARNFGSADDFWENVASQLGIQDSITETKSVSHTEKKTMSWLGKITAWFTAEASVEGTIEKGEDRETNIANTYIVDPFTAIKDQKRSHLLIIDNFHYIQNPIVQREILQELRNLLDNVSVIIIAITDKSDYLNTIEHELIGRNRAITIENWTNQELMDIAHKGFKSLNVELSPLVLQELSGECMGTPAIMQAICLYLGIILGYKVVSSKSVVVNSDDVGYKLKKACKEAARLFDMTQVYNSFLDTVNLNLSDTTRVRFRTQLSRNLTDDNSMYISEAILQTLASQQGLITTMSELKNSYKKFVIIRHHDMLPDFNLIIEKMHHTSELIWQEQIKPAHSHSLSNNINIDIDTSLLFYDKIKDQIRIQDPYFAFYIRWYGYIRGID